MPYGDVVTGGSVRILGGPTSRRRRTVRAVRVTGQRLLGQVIKQAPSMRAAGFWGLVGYGAVQAELELLKKWEQRQLAAMEKIITDSDKAANAAYHKQKAKLERIRIKALEDAALEKSRINYNRWLAGGIAPPETKEKPWGRAYPGMEPFVKVPNLPPPATAATPAGTGAGGGYSTEAPAPVPAPTAAPVTTPGKYKTAAKAAYAWAQTPLGMTLIGTSLALFATAGKSRGAAPFETPFEPPLTELQPEPLFWGELGGVPALDPGFEEEVADEGCENVQPKRAPGECRQGWFEESPSELRLREWSRRPCQ